MDKKSRYAFCFLILFLLLSTCVSYGEDSNGQIELSLQECISLALESNLDIRIQRINPEIQSALLAIARGRFDPSARLGPTVSRIAEPSSTSLSGADVRKSRNSGFSLGVNDPIITGGSYGLSFDTSRAESNSSFQTLNPAYRSGVTLSFNQPLLEGFGPGINRASITIAQNNQDISSLRLKSQLIWTLSEVQKSYWELVFALENLKVQELALEQAEDLLNINRRFKEVGMASISDILQAQSAAASRGADVIAAKDEVKDAEDKLKRITNLVVSAQNRWYSLCSNGKYLSLLPIKLPTMIQHQSLEGT